MAGDHEQIHRGNVRSVVSQKGFPPLTGRPASLDHVFGDTRLRDLKPELEQLTVDARRSPKRIVHAHPPDQYAQFRVDLWPPVNRLANLTPYRRPILTPLGGAVWR